MKTNTSFEMSDEMKAKADEAKVVFQDTLTGIFGPEFRFVVTVEFPDQDRNSRFALLTNDCEHACFELTMATLDILRRRIAASEPPVSTFKM